MTGPRGPGGPNAAQKRNSSTADPDVTICKDELSLHVLLSNVCVGCRAELSSPPSVPMKETPLEPRRAHAALPSCRRLRPGPAPGQPSLPGSHCPGQGGPRVQLKTQFLHRPDEVTLLSRN